MKAMVSTKEDKCLTSGKKGILKPYSKFSIILMRYTRGMCKVLNEVLCHRNCLF